MVPQPSSRPARWPPGSVPEVALRRALVLVLLPLLSACDDPAPPPELALAGADPERGRQTIRAHGCGACHVIPGVEGAVAWVGPPLMEWARRGVLAGRHPNAPEVLVAWLRDPPALSPGTAMPNLGLTEREARDAAAYLFTLGRPEPVPAGMVRGPGEGGLRPGPRIRPRQDRPDGHQPQAGTVNAGAAWNSTASAE